MQRNLSSREEIRIGTTAFIAIEKIRTKLQEGALLRDDDFFKEREYNFRSDAEEIFEGALLKSKNEHEEKKIPIIANIFASTAFYSEISTSEANHILQVADDMTYRQMCILALFERKVELEGISLASTDNSQDTYSDLSALQEIYQLNSFGLVGLREDNNPDSEWSNAQIMVNNFYTAVLSLDNVIPSKMELTNLGKRYFSIMNLYEIPKEDLEELALTLSK